jgi:hypothetical protein
LFLTGIQIVLVARQDLNSVEKLVWTSCHNTQIIIEMIRKPDHSITVSFWTINCQASPVFRFSAQGETALSFICLGDAIFRYRGKGISRKKYLLKAVNLTVLLLELSLHRKPYISTVMSVTTILADAA